MPLKREKVIDNGYIILLILISVLLFYKCRFGFGNIDEAFYLTVPYRLYLGDSLFWDEWNLSQMSGALLYPFIWLFLKLNSSTEGIVLYSRFFFTVVHIFTALFIFGCVRTENKTAAMFLSLFYLAFTPFGIMALSYNSMGLGSMIVCTTLLFGKTPSRRAAVISGAFFAFAVLCCPFLILAFFLMPFFLFGRRKADVASVGRKGFWLWLSGAAGVALVFFIFVFRRIQLEQLIQIIPVLIEDPKHQTKSIFNSFLSFFVAVFRQNSIIRMTFFAAAILLVILLGDTGRASRKPMYLLTVTLLVVIQICQYMRTDRYVNQMLVERSLNFLIMPLNIYLPFLIILKWNTMKKTDLYERVSRYYIIPGILYMFCIHLASDQGLYNISSASFVVLMGTVILLCDQFDEGMETSLERITALLIAGVLAAELGAMILLRYNSVFWETGMEEQSYLLTNGPERGLYVTEYKKKMYDECLSEVENYTEKGKVLFLSQKTWLYLIKDNEFATFSAWLSEDIDDETVERLKEYYRINTGKFPEQIFCEEKYAPLAIELLDQSNYLRNSTDLGSVIYEIHP